MRVSLAVIVIALRAGCDARRLHACIIAVSAMWAPLTVPILAGGGPGDG